LSASKFRVEDFPFPQPFNAYTVLSPRNRIRIYIVFILLAIKKRRDDWTIGVLGFDSRRGAWNFSLPHRVQNGSEAHLASYPMGRRGSFLVGKAAGA
jgi:hypothetical protein